MIGTDTLYMSVRELGVALRFLEGRLRDIKAVLPANKSRGSRRCRSSWT